MSKKKSESAPDITVKQAEKIIKKSVEEIVSKVGLNPLQIELARIQQTVKAPKGKFNSFGKYKYRSCEDILEAMKPHLGACVLTLSDEIIVLGKENHSDARFYVKATARLQLGSEFIETVGFAREDIDKKGMDDSQITGSCSSYARKYALNGLALIEESHADPDAKEPSAPKGAPANTVKSGAPAIPETTEKDTILASIIAKAKKYPHPKPVLHGLCEKITKGKKTAVKDLDLAELKALNVALFAGDATITHENDDLVSKATSSDSAPASSQDDDITI